MLTVVVIVPLSSIARYQELGFLILLYSLPYDDISRITEWKREGNYYIGDYPMHNFENIAWTTFFKVQTFLLLHFYMVW